MNKNILISKNIKETEFFLNTFILGTLIALLNKKISIDEAQKLLFRPGMIENLEQSGISKKYLDVIWAGTELEDLQDLLPNNLQQEIIRLINICLNKFDDINLVDNIYIKSMNS